MEGDGSMNFSWLKADQEFQPEIINNTVTKEKYIEKVSVHSTFT